MLVSNRDAPITGRVQASKHKMGHVTQTTPLFGWFVTHRLGFDAVYMCTKFDYRYSSFNRSRDMVGAHQNLMVHVT